MNILFIHEVDWLAKPVFDIHFLAESLALRGHRVYAIDYEDRWRREGLFDFGSLKTRRFDGVNRSFPGASVDVRRPGFIKIPALARVSAALTHYREIRKTLGEKAIDAIVLYAVPTSGCQALRLGRKRNVPVVFRSIDILNMMVPYGVLRPVTRWLEKRVYAGADLVLPNTPQYMKYVLDMGAPPSRVRLLLFPVDTRLFRPSVDTTEVRQKWGVTEDTPVIIFIGTLFKFSGLDGFLRRFPAILAEVPRARLLIVGDGPQRPVLERIINELGLAQQVTITGLQPYRTMPQYINLATVCVNTFLLTAQTRDIFPAKIVQYVACGKAAVATPLAGITALLPGESHGVVYAPDAAGIAREVVSLLKSPERRQRIERRGLDYVRENFNHEKIAQQLETVLEEAIKMKAGARTGA